MEGKTGGTDIACLFSPLQQEGKSGRKEYIAMKRQISIILITFLGCSVISRAGNTVDSYLRPVQSRLMALKFKPDDLRTLADKQVIVRQLATENLKEMAAFGAVIAVTSANGFVESYRNLSIFRQTPSVVASGLFGLTPSLEDLSGLTIDDKDLYALSKCRVQESGVKLSESDITRFQSLVRSSSKYTPKLKAQLAAEYKKLLVERAQTYLTKGTAGMDSFADGDERIKVHETFVSLAREQMTTVGHCEHIYSYLENFPKAAAPDTESFIYWAKQKFGTLKPVINLVHVIIHREGDRTFIASKQIYSSHYTEGGLSVAELIPFTNSQGQAQTLVLYWIRLQVDMLGGTLSFMKRRMAQPKMLRGLKESLNGIRVAIDSPVTANKVGL